MNDENEGRWSAAIKCPFCKKDIVSIYDPPDSADDIADEDMDPEDVESDDSEAYCSVEVWPCEHVAFSGNWGYEPFSVDEKWAHQCDKIKKALIKKEWIDEAFGSTEEALDEQDHKEILTLMRRVVKDANVGFEEAFMSTGDGPQGNGVAHYMYVFMKMKEKKPAEKSKQDCQA